MHIIPPLNDLNIAKPGHYTEISAIGTNIVVIIVPLIGSSPNTKRKAKLLTSL